MFDVLTQEATNMQVLILTCREDFFGRLGGNGCQPYARQRFCLAVTRCTFGIHSSDGKLEGIDVSIGVATVGGYTNHQFTVHG